MSTRLRSSIQSGVLLLTIESDDGYPRIERTVMSELARRMETLGRDVGLRGCVIIGSDRAFAAGAEISELAELSPADAFEFSRGGQRVFHAIEISAKPVVVAIRGFCMGGGLDLALACHVRLATPDAVFAHPGGALGILTGWGGTQRLSRLIGRSRAMELLSTGRRITAYEALDWQLISRIIPASDLLADAVRLAGKPDARS
ncbi:MAG TPA: enoyl-CoA hydratase/isomerase family protein [Candidatus Limnocylindrales bacterium]|nr:enoyl-CoA hydratase/isomerase family protein [Candidatus Limnocylindrales bacterium]